MATKKKDKELKVVITKGFADSFVKLFSNNLIYIIPRKISDAKHAVKWAWQRVFRGYDDPAVWDFHSHVSEYFPKILRDLKENNMGCPSDLYDSKAKKDKECWKWEEILEQMAKGFDAARKIDNNKHIKEIKLKKPKKDMFGEDSYTDYKYDQKAYDKLKKEFDKGMKLFHKYYFGLWD